jgi:hypothetical protein
MAEEDKQSTEILNAGDVKSPLRRGAWRPRAHNLGLPQPTCADATQAAPLSKDSFALSANFVPHPSAQPLVYRSGMSFAGSHAERNRPKARSAFKASLASVSRAEQWVFCGSAL